MVLPQKPPAPISLLIVEDDKEAVEVLRLTIPLKYPNITIYSAVNGLAGLELFKEHQPQLVITDINMPVMDGIQMAEEISSLKHDTMFIVLTGYSDRIKLEKFTGFTLCDYIVKPLDFGRLFAAIDRCIEEIRSGRQQSP
jgi:YesN/AraC family two-component response regulator